MRRKLKPEQKRKTVSFTIDPKLYQDLDDYCAENDIYNYSVFIEKIIREKLTKLKNKN